MLSDIYDRHVVSDDRKIGQKVSQRQKRGHEFARFEVSDERKIGQNVSQSQKVWGMNLPDLSSLMPKKLDIKCHKVTKGHEFARYKFFDDRKFGHYCWTLQKGGCRGRSPLTN